MYTVKSKKKDENNFDSDVIRRFNDFSWLYDVLITKYGGYIIPVLPDKNFLASLNLENNEFLESRRKDLQSFIQGLLNHHALCFANELRSFLFDDEKVYYSKKK